MNLIQHFLVLLRLAVAVRTQQTIPTFSPTIEVGRCWTKMLAPFDQFFKPAHLKRKFESFCKCCTGVSRARGFPTRSQMVLWLEWLLRKVFAHIVSHTSIPCSTHTRKKKLTHYSGGTGRKGKINYRHVASTGLSNVPH